MNLELSYKINGFSKLSYKINGLLQTDRYLHCFIGFKQSNAAQKWHDVPS